MRRDSLGPTDVGLGVDGKLAFGQVYEDPTFELAAIDARGGHVLGPTSGGDTALAFLAAGAARVTAVDINRTQNHHAELIHLARTALPAEEALALIGAYAMPADRRVGAYRGLRDALTAPARQWWDERPRLVARGAIHAGRTERGMRATATLMARTLTSPAAIRDLLASTDLHRQRGVFDRRVQTRRWRAGLALALNPTTCRPLYREFFENIDASQFTASVRDGITAVFRDVPIWRNWYLHGLFEKQFRPDALPPHLADDSADWGEFRLVDGDLTTVLAATEPSSLRGVWLSNVGEWMLVESFTALLAAAADAVEPGGRVVWSNFVPRRDPLPAALAERLVPVAAPAGLIDRSLVRYQRVICEVQG